jgi:hypothetical protein
MTVGPSHAPITATDTASSLLKPSQSAKSSVTKMPSCPAAPKSSSFGFASSGVKSVIEPMAMKISSGNNSLPMPMS